uniref:Uncharacterized protein n=1 Tax=Ananas comosus var. bracteatus TaxID=296719 RepID=A0A6V7PD09_ANACO|nr:unnamed protein product [Ananas comosus var. bracteatus]
MANHIPLPLPLLYFLRLSIVLLLLLPLPGIAAPPQPPESQLEFTLRLRAVKGLADHLYGVPTPELDIFVALHVVNPADEELCFRRGAATVKHESTSTVLAKGVTPDFCVAAESARDVGMWAHGRGRRGRRRRGTASPRSGCAGSCGCRSTWSWWMTPARSRSRWTALSIRITPDLPANPESPRTTKAINFLNSLFCITVICSRYIGRRDKIIIGFMDLS